MRLFAIALLLFAWALQYPEPNRGAEKPDVKERNAQVKASKKKAEPSSTAPTQTISGNLYVSEPHAQAKQEGSYDARRDPLYRWYLGATIAGVGGAIVGIIVLICQTKATKKAADAALRNAQVVINSERAWLDIDLIPVAPGRSGDHYLRVSNHGKTPGFVTGWVLGRGYWNRKEEILLGSIGNAPTPDKKSLHNMIPANTPGPITLLNFDVAKYPPGEGWQFATYHGHLTYRDIFKQEHRTEVVYRFVAAANFLDPMPEYTRYITKTEKGEETD